MRGGPRLRLWRWSVFGTAVAVAVALGAVGDPARLAGRLRDAGHPKAATWALRWSALGEPTDASRWLRLASGYERLGRRDAVLRALARAEEAAGDDGDALVEVGTRFMRARDYPRACRALERAAEIPGAHRGIAVNNLGFTWAKRGDHARALGYYEEASGILRPHDVFPQGNRAIALAHLGRWDEAREMIRELRARFAENPIAWYKSSVAHAVLGERDEAIADLHAALARGFRQRWWIGREEDLSGLAGDPRFDALARRRREKP